MNIIKTELKLCETLCPLWLKKTMSIIKTELKQIKMNEMIYVLTFPCMSAVKRVPGTGHIFFLRKDSIFLRLFNYDMTVGDASSFSIFN
jgi:hypothetical protein